MFFDLKLGRAVAAGLLVLGATTVALGWQNGYLPSSALSRIYHPTDALYLENEAARSWNAMREFMVARGVGDIYPGGSISAYRTYAQQVYARQVYGSNAAIPGTSNHGLGLAVDLATPTMRANLDRYGAQFGWAKRWSDAPWEWWHIKYQPGVWSGGGGGGAAATILRVGDSGPKVATLQQALDARGAHLAADGAFGPLTQAAVKSFQRTHGLLVDGIAGPQTLRALNLSTL